MTRAVVVDDSNFMRTMIQEMLERNGVDVVATAADGRDAVAAVCETDPDVVTMDVEMPGVDGIEAVERIMTEHPTPILMLSAYTEEGGDRALEALDRGAVDFVTKPDGEVSVKLTGFETQIVEKVERVARSDLDGPSASSSSPVPNAGVREPTTVVVGSSTGGPRVLERLASELPRGLDARILVVQHMMDDFTEQFADRLDAVSEYDFREATGNDSVAAGQGLVAQGGYHMEVTRANSNTLTVELNRKPELHGVRPAIDLTMESAASHVSDGLVGVVLTGMGKDGAVGIRAIKDAGGHTIAQDEATSQVFGIPRAAIETGAVDDVLPEGSVADGIAAAVKEVTKA